MPQAAVLRGHEQFVTGMAFSPDSRRIVSGSEDKTVKLWDVESGKELLTLRGPKGIGSVALTKDSKRVGGACGNDVLHWNITK